MAQVTQDDRDIDPITQSFIVDRQAFWGRFTSFTTWSAGAVVLLLIGLWLFVA